MEVGRLVTFSLWVEGAVLVEAKSCIKCMCMHSQTTVYEDSCFQDKDTKASKGWFYIQYTEYLYKTYSVKQHTKINDDMQCALPIETN